MASTKPPSPVARGRALFSFVRERVKRDRPFQLAAAIAYFFLLALQPLLIVSTSLLAYLPIQSIEPRIASFCRNVLPGAPGERVSAIVSDVLERRNPRLVSLGAVFALWTASMGTKAVIDATTLIRGIERDPRSWLAQRLRAILLTLGLVLLVATGAVVAAGLPRAIRAALGEPLAVPSRALELSLGFLLMMSGVQLVYRYGPPPPRTPALPGAIVAVLGALLASEGLTLYVRHVRDLNAIYGSLGALVLLVLWFYVLGCALVLGAEVNAALGARASELPSVRNERPEHRLSE